MNKQIITVFLILSLISASYAAKGGFCVDCIKDVDNSINTIIQKIIQGGIITSCGAVCSFFPGSILQAACDIGCDAIGIDEFIKLIQDVNFDPIYMCELMTFCKFAPNAAAAIDGFSIYPENGYVCDTFSVGISYNVSNLIGTGEVAFSVVDPFGNVAAGEANIVVEVAPGVYNAQFQFQANPSQGESYPTGSYELQVAVCEGACGSDHKGSKLLSLASSNFTLINDQSSSNGQSSGSNSQSSGSNSGFTSGSNSGFSSGSNSGSGSGSAQATFLRGSASGSSSQPSSGSSTAQCAQSSGSGSGSGQIRFKF